ncbi:MAG TPA: ABC transporter permease [Leifsonia sp.]|jgi:ribose transport system permease protein|nr:Inner-rane translocator [Microbacteriaceae bacterium]HEV7811691.1 ABC transporter permease [Leifsonia sp.]
MTTTTALPAPTSSFTRLRRRHGWLAGVVVLLIVFVVLRATQIPNFGGFELRTILAGSMALAFLAMAQGVVVISGGINIAVGALMVFANCLAARFMLEQDALTATLIAVAVIAVCAIISGIMGLVITISGVPDIIVTLALSFVIGGMALLVLPAPGGGIPLELQPLIVGGFSDPLPAVLWLTIAFVAIWLPFKRSRWGIATYAVGSQRNASYLSGVNVANTRIRAYVLSGVFVGMAGIVTTAFTGGGEPRASIGLAALLSSVAAVVLGGVALTGGSGGLLGPILAALILSLIPAIMLGFGWNPNYAEVARGAILILVVMFGGYIQMRKRTT